MNGLRVVRWMAGPMLALACAFSLAAQTPPQKLTRADAEAIAIKNQPSLQSAQLRAEAAKQLITEVRSAYYPTATANLTGAVAETNTRITSGFLNNPSVFDRYANGVAVSQLLTDFGRTGNLTRAAQYQAEAQQQTAAGTRATVLLRVDLAYYGALRAIAVQRVATETVKTRQVVADQVSELARNKLKSGLDVSFAKVNLSEAKLLLVQAENGVNAAFAELSAAMGFPELRTFELAEDSLPPTPPADPALLIADALRQRPELMGQRATSNSSHSFAKAERDLWFPTISAAGAAGFTPEREAPLVSHYGAAGFNVQIPIFNGMLFKARRAEADLQARAADQDLRNLEEGVARDVRVAWLNATAAYQRVELTGELLQQATQALSLARARYDLGLSSIVELSQAQLNSTEAEIQQASAKYEYQISISALNFQTGAIR
jgi:outer membrane protein